MAEARAQEEPVLRLLRGLDRPRRLLEKHGVEILRTLGDRGFSTAYHIVCPWVGEHTDEDTSGTRVGQYADGAVWFHCDHGHCQGRKWRQFREHFEPGCYEPRWLVKVGGKIV